MTKRMKMRTKKIWQVNSVACIWINVHKAMWGYFQSFVGFSWSCVSLWDYAKIAVRGHSQDYLFIIRFTSENISARFIREILFLYLVSKKRYGTSSNIVYGYGLFIFNWVFKRKYLVIKMAGSVVFFFGVD